jgi:hypothetical protein
LGRISLLGFASALAIHGSTNLNLAIVSNQYFSSYHSVLKRHSSTKLASLNESDKLKTELK